MKATKLISLMVLLFVQTAVNTVFSQEKPMVGDTISGIVCDKDGPMIWINVVELDSLDRVVAHALTDLGGKFFFRLVNPDDRIQIPFVGYETVVLPIDKTYFEIKMKEDDLMQNNTTTPDTRPHVRGIIGSGSYPMAVLQKNAPRDYVCGYVMQDPWGTYLYGLYLVKEKNRYSLVYKKSDYTERRNIKSRQAKELISSVESTLAYADVPKKAANTAGSNGSGIAIPLYDGNTAYAVSPDKAVYFWTGNSEDVPDETWQKEYLKFK